MFLKGIFMKKIKKYSVIFFLDERGLKNEK